MQSIKERVVINVRLKEQLDQFANELFYLLFEEEESYTDQVKHVKGIFIDIADHLLIDNAAPVWKEFITSLPEIRKKILLDAKAMEENDPASNGIEEVILAYPGFYAIAIYRLSHELFSLNIPIIPRMMSENAHRNTGIDIHPGAKIGEHFFIDHGTGIVIGETVIIKDNVKIYQGVTLGAFHVRKSMASKKRHPTIEDNVIIYANATILGGDTIIGQNSTIGANVWITESVPSHSYVYHKTESIINPKK